MRSIEITDLSIVTYPVVYAWVLDEPMRYEVPIPYAHNQGAVKWVVLTKSASTGDSTSTAATGHERVAATSPRAVASRSAAGPANMGADSLP